MTQRKRMISWLSFLTVIFLILAMCFVYQMVDLISFIRSPSRQLSEYSLIWFPSKYPMVLEEFKINEIEVKHVVIQGEVEVSLSFPTKLSKNFRNYYRINSRHISGQNQLVIGFKKDYSYLFSLVAIMLVVLVVAVVVEVVSSTFRDKLKLLPKSRKVEADITNIEEEIREA